MNGPKPPACKMIVEIAIPEIKNERTATIDLMLNLASPHSPWPLVHPFESFVPIPTRIPAKANPSWEV